ncbi:MAG: MFS transporter [Deltaproteobacteria bacterium]|nr:MFS transporter [Deltaproteobacteria bacterium]
MSSAVENTSKLPRSDVFNYAFYMTSEMLFLMMPVNFMNIFLTDNLLISLTLAGSVLAIARILDAIAGLVSGMIIQKTREKGIYYSKWITATRWVIGCGVILMFSNTSAMPLSVKLVIVFIAYCMINLSMNFIQTSQFNVLAIMGGTSLEKRNLLAFRGTQGVTIATFIGSISLVPIINKVLTPLIGSNYAYFVMGIVCVIPYMFGCHFLAKSARKYEETSPLSVGRGVRVIDMIKSVFTNDQLLILILVMSASYIAQYTVMTVAVHYFTYVLGNVMLMTYSMTIGTIVSVAGAFIGPKIGVMLGKKRAMVVGLLGQCLALVLVCFLARTSVIAYIILYSLFSLAMYTYFSFNANYTIDTGEYHLHKTGRDNRSVANGMMNLPFKIGLLIGGSVPMLVLSKIGYQPNMEQTPEFINKFMMMFGLFPAAFCLLAAILMQFFYKITDKDAARYAKENQERAAAAMAASGKATSS